VITFAIVLGALAYLFIGGMFGRAFYDKRGSECPKCNSQYKTCYVDHRVSAFWAGVLWPLTLPVVSGYLTTGALASQEREKRRKTRHDRRMARIKAENEGKKLELQKAKLNITYLEANGVNASVPGLFEDER
jgi:hypothetical protein